MAITCKGCGIISTERAERCDCGRALTAELQKHDEDLLWRNAPRQSRRQPLFVLSGAVLGAFVGVMIATTVFRPGPASSSSSGLSGLPPAMEVPLELAAGLGSAAVTLGGGLCTLVMGVLFGAILGGTAGLALARR